MGSRLLYKSHLRVPFSNQSISDSSDSSDYSDFSDYSDSFDYSDSSDSSVFMQKVW